MPPVKLTNSAYCPPVGAVIDPKVFDRKLEIEEKETAFETVSRMKEIDEEKAASGRRLTGAYEKCQAAGGKS